MEIIILTLVVIALFATGVVLGDIVAEIILRSEKREERRRADNRRGRSS